MRFLDWIDRGIRGIGVVTAWLTVVSIAAYGALQMLDRKLQLGVSSYLPDLSTSLLFILIFLTFGYTYLRDGHVRVDVLRRHWSARRIAWIELIGGLFVLLPDLLRMGRFDAHHEIRGNPVVGTTHCRGHRPHPAGSCRDDRSPSQHRLSDRETCARCTGTSKRPAQW